MWQINLKFVLSGSPLAHHGVKSLTTLFDVCGSIELCGFSVKFGNEHRWNRFSNAALLQCKAGDRYDKWREQRKQMWMCLWALLSLHSVPLKRDPLCRWCTILTAWNFNKAAFKGKWEIGQFKLALALTKTHDKSNYFGKIIKENIPFKWFWPNV